MPPGLQETTALALRTATELRRGIDRGEIVPYYQPIVELTTGHVVGFEALARWLHPERGLLAPEQFLSLAEETGLVGHVGEVVLRDGLAQLAQWRARDLPFADAYLAVNVGTRQVVDPAFAELVAGLLGETGIPADSLWLEITESALLADVKASTVAMRHLRGLGLHLAVDDFGTGYSSLTYLKRFPVEAIKIDRSFVAGLGLDNEDTTIVEAVVNLGHSFHLDVIAEGLETPLQLARLRTHRVRPRPGLPLRPPPPGVDHRERAHRHLTLPTADGAGLRPARSVDQLTGRPAGSVRRGLRQPWAERRDASGSGSLLADLDGERRRHCGLAADPELVEALDAEVGAVEGGEQLADRAPVLAVAADPLARAGRPDGGEGMVEHEHERCTGLEHTVHLAQDAAEVVDVVERVHGEHDVDRAARREAEVAEVTLVALDRDVGVGGRDAQVGQPLGVGIDGDRLGAAEGESDRVGADDPQLDDAPPAGHVAEQSQLVVARDVCSICHVVGHGIAHGRPVWPGRARPNGIAESGWPFARLPLS